MAVDVIASLPNFPFCMWWNQQWSCFDLFQAHEAKCHFTTSDTTHHLLLLWSSHGYSCCTIGSHTFFINIKERGECCIGLQTNDAALSSQSRQHIANCSESLTNGYNFVWQFFRCHNLRYRNDNFPRIIISTRKWSVTSCPTWKLIRVQRPLRYLLRRSSVPTHQTRATFLSDALGSSVPYLRNRFAND